MCDIASLTLPQLRARLHDCIERRLDSVTPQDRARSGDELLGVLEELARRDARGAAPRPRPLVHDVPAPRSTTTLLAQLELRPSAHADLPAPAHSRSAAD